MNVMNGLVFAGTLFKALGAAALAAGGCLALLGASKGAQGGYLRHWLALRWLGVSQCGWKGIPCRQARWLLCSINLIIQNYFAEADRSAVFGALFIGVMFFIIPAAALINLIAGGSPLLFMIFLSCALAILAHNFTGEVRKLFVANGLLSIYLGFCLFLLVPVYIFRSFTGRILKEVIGHAFLESIPMAFLCYILAYCVMMTLWALLLALGAKAGKGRLTMAVNGFLAALPVSYALVFLALLAGHLATSETPYKDWPLLISGLVFGSISLPLTMALAGSALSSSWRLLLALAAAFVLAAFLSCALYYFGYPQADANMALLDAWKVLMGFSGANDQVFLGSAFFVTRLPFLPVFFFVLTIVIGWLAKAILIPFRNNAAKANPFFLSGSLCFAIGAPAYAIGVFIQQAAA